MTAGPYLTVWIGPSSHVDAAGVRHDVPRHLIGISTPYVRGEADAPLDVFDVFDALDALRARGERKETAADRSITTTDGKQERAGDE